MGAIAKNVIGLLDGRRRRVHSSLDGPIESLSFLRRSLLFAELSNLSYLSRAEAGRLAYRIGFPEIRYYDRDGAQAYIFANDDDAVVTCRGTEPHDWNDVQGRPRPGNVRWPKRSAGSIAASSARSTTSGRGSNRRWSTTPARCGSPAIRWAARWPRSAPAAAELSYIRSNPRALYTYGSPRIGNRRYVNYVQIEAYRWVNNNDIVTRVPPGWLGFATRGRKSTSTPTARSAG